MKNKILPLKEIKRTILLTSIILFLTSINFIDASYSKQNFTVNTDTEVFLDIEGDIDTYYNGTITVTVTEGVGVNATVNGVTLEVNLGESKEFAIANSSILYFSITSQGLSQGFYELELNLNLNAGDRNPITIVVGILAAFLIGLSIVSYYIRSKRMEPKEDEDDEKTMDPETTRKRKEAAGAEKRYLGLDDEL